MQTLPDTKLAHIPDMLNGYINHFELRTSSFPVVICASPFLQVVPRKHGEVSRTPFVERVSWLTRYLNKTEVLKERILKLINQYGMLRLYSGENSLRDWINEAKRARFYLNLAELVRSELKKPEAEQATVAELLETTFLLTHPQCHSIHNALGEDRHFFDIVVDFVQDEALDLLRK